MSHTMNIEVEMHDIQALKLACRRLGLTLQEQGKVKFYDGTIAEGILVHLPGWKYPICIKGNGQVAYDNYNGKWGKEEELNKLHAYYGLEKAKIEARKKGYSVYETRDTTGELVLKIRIGG